MSYLGPSIGGAGDEVMVLEKVASTYGGGPLDVEQPATTTWSTIRASFPPTPSVRTFPMARRSRR